MRHRYLRPVSFLECATGQALDERGFVLRLRELIRQQCGVKYSYQLWKAAESLSISESYLKTLLSGFQRPSTALAKRLGFEKTVGKLTRPQVIH